MSSQGRSRKVLFMAFGAGGFLFALLGLNDVTGIWPQPWLFLEIVVALGSMLVMFQSIIIITYMHPIAPRAEARKWAWAGVSYRFWFLLAGVWRQSYGWALLWGLCGIVSAVIAYLAGRPWPRAD